MADRLVRMKNDSISATSVYKCMGLLFTLKLAWTKARKSIHAIKTYQRLNNTKPVSNQLINYHFCELTGQDLPFHEPTSFGQFVYSDFFKLFDLMIKPILTPQSKYNIAKFCDAIKECTRRVWNDVNCIDHHVKSIIIILM